MISRRGFIQSIATFPLILMGIKTELGRAADYAIPVEKIKDLQTIGGAVILRIRGKNVMFIRDTEKSVRALDPTCTHKGCTVGYNKRRQRIECPCHKSAYSLEGKVLDGPAPAPLKTYQAGMEDGRIVFNLDSYRSTRP